MPRASLRVRLTSWHAMLLMATIAALGVAVFILMSQSLLRRVDAMLDFEFAEAAERLAAQLPVEALADSPAFHQEYFLRVRDGRGRIEAESPGLSGLDLPTSSSDDEDASPAHSSVVVGGIGRCRVVTGVVGRGEGRRVIQIATPLRTYEADLAELRGVLWAILPAGLAASTLGGYWLSGRALAPVGRMTEAARRISAANLGERLEVAVEEDELGRLATTLNAMLDRIDRAFVAARRFTADAAHELRTPLTSLRAEAEVALIVPRSPDDYRDTLRSVVEEADRLARLADRLLLLASEDSGASLPRRSFRLDEAVRAAAARAAEPAVRAGIALRVGDLPVVAVEGDRDLLRQAFDNLIENAVKYTPAGGVVTLEGRLDDGRAVVEVVDTGVGIPADALPRVFDRFFRVDVSRSRRTGGTGLGLSIAKAVVERHGGTIEAAGEPGRGATFRVALPIAPDGPAA
ncbi:ATP-binding protein [Planctomyces sp. SH-PL62]|uniref:ATP-binding protein n=1 Tax=Planctomyces sp. SH-PL62 TaxID=1636152 RepID=UPI00078D797C|nr:ATP-binding protein [Planctomyces sp. SH-PL62]AMV38723.1 Sensor kinase CusS [Planctomyces sp. SH-PL62]